MVNLCIDFYLFLKLSFIPLTLRVDRQPHTVFQDLHLKTTKTYGLGRWLSGQVLNKHEDMNLDPQDTTQKPVVIMCAYNHSA